MRREFSLLSADGKTQLHAVEHRPEGVEPRAVVQLSHGMVEYIGRYRPFAEWLAAHGYVVVGHDHLGHGASVQSQEDWGYFGENPSDLLVSDMHALRTRAQAENPGLPYFMLGHSMGSYLLRKYLEEHGEGLSGALVVGTGFAPKATTGAAMTFIRSRSRVRGERHRSATVQRMTFGKEYQRFDMTGEDPSNSWLTKDEDIVRQYYSDPRTTFQFTLNGYMGLMEAVRDACDPEKVAQIPKGLPILVTSGAEDPVGAFGVGVQQAVAQLMQCGVRDVTYHLYENDRHEILNELDRETVYADMDAWMTAHMGITSRGGSI